MKNKITNIVNYLIPENYSYKIENKYLGYLLVFVLSIIPFYAVYLAEIAIEASDNYYWLDHLFFGIAGPWVFGCQAWFWCRHHSFKLGVAITVFVSLGNEYYFDILERGGDWEFIEQVTHTISDGIGVLISYLLYKYLLKKT